MSHHIHSQQLVDNRNSSDSDALNLIRCADIMLNEISRMQKSSGAPEEDILVPSLGLIRKICTDKHFYDGLLLYVGSPYMAEPTYKLVNQRVFLPTSDQIEACKEHFHAHWSRHHEEIMKISAVVRKLIAKEMN